MQRMNQKERFEAAGVALTEGRFGSHDQAISWLGRVEPMARELHRIYVRQCNGYQVGSTGREDTKRREKDEAREALLVSELREAFSNHGMGMYLNGDPRGNPVGILTPKTGRYNTMGGAECGWRL